MMKLTPNPHANQGEKCTPEGPCHGPCQCQGEVFWSAAVRATLEDVAREADAYAAERLAESEGVHTTWVDAARELAARYRKAAEDL